MRIAAITITYNDDYKFKEWCEHYEEYKTALYLHIIVDNSSRPDYLRQVKNYFSDSIIIENQSNEGCTGAYNKGIQAALEYDEVDSIMLIGNDIKINGEDVAKLHEFLFSKDSYGMVSPILLTPGTNIIECYGSQLNWLGNDKRPFVGQNINDDIPPFREVEYVTGGMSLSKRIFYEEVGLQDENLFMYADELDMYYRSKNKGFVEAVTKDSIAYHCHINPNKSTIRKPEMFYLHGRNVVYLYRKHTPRSWFFKFLVRFIRSLIPVLLHPCNQDLRTVFKYHCKGYRAGINNNMDNSFLK